MKVKIKAHIHYNKYRWDDKGEFEVFSFKFDDFTLENYDPHPAIKGVVAV